jgi:hypothetical protein
MKSTAINHAAQNASATPNSSGEPAASATSAQVPEKTEIVIAQICRVVVLGCRVRDETLGVAIGFSFSAGGSTLWVKPQTVTSMFRYSDWANESRTAQLTKG